jgi:TRAP-type C4-dicarboxylate transport system permease small subunit
VTNVFAIPKNVLYSCMPIAAAVMIVYSIRDIVREILALVRRTTA